VESWAGLFESLASSVTPRAVRNDLARSNTSAACLEVQADSSTTGRGLEKNDSAAATPVPQVSRFWIDRSWRSDTFPRCFPTLF
jgi:hypothetical protein